MDLSRMFDAAILGVVEGVTEFLPISSTGHLLLVERMLRFGDPGEVFTVFIQLGAILAVLLISWRRLVPPILQLGRPDAVGARARTFALSIVLATLPAVLIGAPADKWAEKHLMSLEVVAVAFALGGLAILLIERVRHRDIYADATALPARVALIIGFCQVLAALFPGTSRSGATIMGALLLGVARPAATEFSFFLAIPVMIGASALKLWKHGHELDAGRVGELAVGFIVAFIVAWFVIRWLIRFVASHDFKPFGWYRLAAGLLIALGLALHWFPPPQQDAAPIVAPAARVHGAP